MKIGVIGLGKLGCSMFAAFAVFLIFAFGLSPQLGNHGLWLAFFLFLTVRGGILAVLYPALRRSLT